MPSRIRRRAVVVSSRLKGFTSFQELFQNTLRNGWKVIRSGWTAGSNRVSASNPTQYPLLSTTMSKPNVTIDITSPGIGTGAALWVTDAGNWFAVVTSQELSMGTGNCDTYTPVDNCGAGQNCIPTGGPYNYQYNYDFGSNCINSVTNSNPAIPASFNNWSCSCMNANNCQAGQVPAGDYCYQSNCANIAYNAYYCGWVTVPHQYYDNCKTGGNCVASGGNCRSYGNCLVYGSYYISCCKAYNAYNSCAYLNPCVGGYIYWTTEESAAPCCAPGQVCTQQYTQSNCATGSPGYSYCGYCGYDPGQSAGFTTNSCSCCATNAPDVRLVNGSGDSYNPCGARNGCIATGGNCTHYQDTYPRKVKIFKYVSNVLSEVTFQTLDSLTSFPIIRSLRVIVTNAVKGGSTATVTVKAYSDTLFTNQIGTDFIHQATGLKINTNYGIIANPSTYNEDISAQQVSIS